MRRGEEVEEVTAFRADSLHWAQRLSSLPVADEGGGTTEILLALMGYIAAAPGYRYSTCANMNETNRSGSPSPTRKGAGG